jgi:hypothetical protein
MGDRRLWTNSAYKDIGLQATKTDVPTRYGSFSSWVQETLLVGVGMCCSLCNIDLILYM